MRISIILGATLAALASLRGAYCPSAQAIQLADGTVSFDKPPDLVSVSTTFQDVNVWGVTYFFTISLPSNAGEPLQQVTINQVEGLDDIRFSLKETYAVEGTGWHSGKRLTLGEVTKDKEKHAVLVKFNPPVPPGTTFTLALRPERNPFDDGVYLFGVTAFPVGEKPYGLYLGVGRLHFYRGDSSRL
jgi:hypothetical protein